MQRMRPHIPPEPIQPHFTGRRPRLRRLEHPARDPERRVRRHHLYACGPFGYFAALGGCDVAFGCVVRVDGGDFEARDIGEGFGGAEVCEEGAVALEDVGFFGGGCGGGGGVGPGARVFGGVVGGEVEGAEGDADVEVWEDD